VDLVHGHGHVLALTVDQLRAVAQTRILLQSMESVVHQTMEHLILLQQQVSVILEQQVLLVDLVLGIGLAAEAMAVQLQTVVLTNQ
jgi:hypothetical protein